MAEARATDWRPSTARDEGELGAATLPRPTLPLLPILATVFAGWLHRHQQRVRDYLLEENRILKRHLRGRRLRLTDSDHCRLAVRGHALGRKLLQQFAHIVSPETILRWHRRLIAQKWTFPTRRVDRRAVMRTIEEISVRMARENPTWGYDRIVGALNHLGHKVAPNTVKKILRAPRAAAPGNWESAPRARGHPAEPRRRC